MERFSEYDMIRCFDSLGTGDQKILALEGFFVQLVLGLSKTLKYRVFQVHCQNVVAYSGQKTTYQLRQVTSFSFDWVILISNFQKITRVFRYYPSLWPLEVKNCGIMRNILNIYDFCFVLFCKHICNKSSDLYEIIDLSS